MKETFAVVSFSIRKRAAGCAVDVTLVVVTFVYMISIGDREITALYTLKEALVNSQHENLAFDDKQNLHTEKVERLLTVFVKIFD